MGAPESKPLRGFIPKERVGSAATWSLQPLTPAAEESQAAEREQQAYERGLAQGRAEGAAQERQRRLQQADQLEALCGSLRARFAELERAGADALLDCALAIAQHVLRQELATRRDALLPVAREAVARVIDSQAQPRIYVHPDDYALLAAELHSDGLLKGCQFIADSRIERGGCRVETALSEVDATVSTRWRRVLAALGIDLTGGEGSAASHAD
ncbi:MAG: FliH/SctL family protein [Sutterellaceae bacterium]|nr:FliH/SctL family protein [Burkholderiaceae bacterium]MCX7900689.1 FliH/SctL family protein [Burkholderiaceae bacterium]MDW8431015.1 FliH/SctL family protein [Sutterellaceae bacterium]